MSESDPHAKHGSPYQLFMLVLCVLVLVSLGYEAVAQVDPEVSAILFYVDTAVCVIFFADFLVSLARAPDRLRYLFTWGWVDLLSSIPAVPYLRWGRAARVVRILRVLRGVRSVRYLGALALQRRSQTGMLAAMLIAMLTVVASAIAVLQFERAAGGSIDSGPDALWWSIVTVTSVGYGDLVPVSPEGRAVGAILMTVALGLFGALTAFLASWFIQPDVDEQDEELSAIRRELGEMRVLLEGRG